MVGNSIESTQQVRIVVLWSLLVGYPVVVAGEPSVECALKLEVELLTSLRKYAGAACGQIVW